MSAVRRLAVARGAAARAADAQPVGDRAASTVRTTDRTTDRTNRLARNGRTQIRSTDMNQIDEQLARQRWHEACTEAQQARLVRAVRAERRARRAERTARRATEVARRAADRVVLA